MTDDELRRVHALDFASVPLPQWLKTRKADEVRALPVLPAVLTAGELRAACDGCGETHRHGDREGLRRAHCKSGPYVGGSYAVLRDR